MFRAARVHHCSFACSACVRRLHLHRTGCLNQCRVAVMNVQVLIAAPRRIVLLEYRVSCRAAHAGKQEKLYYIQQVKIHAVWG